MMSVYLLSIIDGLSTGFAFAGILAAAGTMPYYMVSDINSMHEGKEGRETMKQVRKTCRNVLILASVLIFLSALIPNKKDLIEAYAIVEGRKVLTADNVKVLADEITKRVDQKIGYQPEAEDVSPR